MSLQSSSEIQTVQTKAKEMRVDILKMLTAAKSGHPGGSLSCTDLIAALFFNTLRGLPKTQAEFAKPSLDRDRFVLSKGHAVPALYAAFKGLGFLTEAQLLTLRQTGSQLQGHPDRVRMPMVEASTGSLGQGLSVAQGLAMGFKLDQKNYNVFCLMGDGEIQEGQVWESALCAPKFKLNNLCAIVDWNNGQIDGPVSDVMPLEPLADKWRSFGWNVSTINGHNLDEILNAYEAFKKSAADKNETKPTMILAKTIKGKGVSFMENKIEWHGVAPKADERDRAVAEILASK